MIKRLHVIAGVAMLLSGASFAASDPVEMNRGPAGAADAAAAAIAKCDQLGGAAKASCMQQARESSMKDGTATGATQSGNAATGSGERAVRRRSAPPPSGGGMGGASNPF